ncbi:hypothetical protein [Burkholderia sp. BCC1972]|uniref:hypothetical protein n=1 Tax=Burkholderia sp. BCC1972 TaxID=2817438 RepID=UPI002ABE8BDE|nr:hypothetical protein [Burkholderia sp. BCC1972]
MTTESSFAAFDANRRILRGFFSYPQRMWITLLKSSPDVPLSRAGRPSGLFDRPFGLWEKSIKTTGYEFRPAKAAASLDPGPDS